jgi:hypothetical protein
MFIHSLHLEPNHQIVEEMEVSTHEERLAGEALQLAELALQCLALEKSDRATVQAVLPDLEEMLRTRQRAESTAPAGMHYDPETGELVQVEFAPQ